MATFTISAPKELPRVKKEFPNVNWNNVMKAGILERLEELKKFEVIRKLGVLESPKFEEFLSKLKKGGVI